MAAENNPLQKAENTPKYKVQSEVAQSCQTVIPWTIAYQAPPSMEFSRQVYRSGLPFPSPGDLPNPGIEPGSPTLQADALPSELPGNTPALRESCPISKGCRKIILYSQHPFTRCWTSTSPGRQEGGKQFCSKKAIF